MEAEFLLSLCIGIGLSAACGFRVFIPLLVMSIASYSGHLQLASGFEWIGTPVALTTFSLATALEITAYYVPWLDNALDSIATPAAAIAGTVVMASMVADVSPYLKWSLAVIAGGGAATLVQGATVLVRGVSTATTAGLANPLFATIELGGSVATSVLAILSVPTALLVLAAVLFFTGRKLYQIRMARTSTAPPRIA